MSAQPINWVPRPRSPWEQDAAAARAEVALLEGLLRLSAAVAHVDDRLPDPAATPVEPDDDPPEAP